MPHSWPCICLDSSLFARAHTEWSGPSLSSRPARFSLTERHWLSVVSLGRTSVSAASSLCDYSPAATLSLISSILGSFSPQVLCLEPHMVCPGFSSLFPPSQTLFHPPLHGATDSTQTIIVTSGAPRSYYLIRKASGRIFYMIHVLLFCNHQTANRSLTGNVEATKHVK